MERSWDSTINWFLCLHIGPHIWTEYHKLKSYVFKFRTILFELGQPSLKDSFLDKMSKDLTLNWINPWFRKIFANGCPQSVFLSNNPPGCGWPGGWPIPPMAPSAVISERSRKYPQVKFRILIFFWNSIIHISNFNLNFFLDSLTN